MSLRSRLTLLTALAFAACLVVLAVVVPRLVRTSLMDRLDGDICDTRLARAERRSAMSAACRDGAGGARSALSSAAYVELRDVDGELFRGKFLDSQNDDRSAPQLPDDADAERRAVHGRLDQRFEPVAVAGRRLRGVDPHAVRTRHPVARACSSSRCRPARSRRRRTASCASVWVTAGVSLIADRVRDVDGHRARAAPAAADGALRGVDHRRRRPRPACRAPAAAHRARRSSARRSTTCSAASRPASPSSRPPRPGCAASPPTPPTSCAPR